MLRPLHAPTPNGKRSTAQRDTSKQNPMLLCKTVQEGREASLGTWFVKSPPHLLGAQVPKCHLVPHGHTWCPCVLCVCTMCLSAL